MKQDFSYQKIQDLCRKSSSLEDLCKIYDQRKVGLALEYGFLSVLSTDSKKFDGQARFFPDDGPWEPRHLLFLYESSVEYLGSEGFQPSPFFDPRGADAVTVNCYLLSATQIFDFMVDKIPREILLSRPLPFRLAMEQYCRITGDYPPDGLDF